MTRRWALLFAALAFFSCSKSEEVIIKTAAGRNLTAIDLDRDPIALLPDGPVAVLSVDAQAQFRSAFGQRLKQIVESRLPVPPSANFVPERDLDRTFVGIYSMQGVDFAGVALGRFNPAAIQQAADGTVNTPLGSPLVRSDYGGRQMYVSANVGFVVLTERVVLFGNETGMRRALDRIQSGHLENRIPPWIEQFFQTQQGPVVAAMDLTSRPEVAAGARGIPGAQGLTTATAVGNFESPGMNLGGRLSYSDADHAARGAQAILALRQRIQSYSWLTSLMGLGDPIQSLRVQPVGPAVDLNLSLNGATTSQLIEQLANAIGAPTGPVRATTSPLR
jgi:hypothetical protein